MSDTDRALRIVSHDLLMARNGLGTDSIPDLMARLSELRKQKWAEFSEGLAADIERERKAFMERHKTIEPSWLTPLGFDQYLTRTGEIREQRCDIRPDL